jgi:hypothetical protein
MDWHDRLPGTDHLLMGLGIYQKSRPSTCFFYRKALAFWVKAARPFLVMERTALPQGWLVSWLVTYVTNQTTNYSLANIRTENYGKSHFF